MFQVGDIVTFAEGRYSEHEKGKLSIVAEWNGDRGLIRPVQTSMVIVPHELVKDTDLVKASDLNALYDAEAATYKAGKYDVAAMVRIRIQQLTKI